MLARDCFATAAPQRWHKWGGGNTPPVALWWPVRMNMRKWGRHPVNNSCHCAPQQAAELRGEGAEGPCDMPGPDMAPRPRAVTPAETSPPPPQFVHLTLQLAHDRCLFPRTGFSPSEPRAHTASGISVCPRCRSLYKCVTTPVILFTSIHIAFAAHWAWLKVAWM